MTVDEAISRSRTVERQLRDEDRVEAADLLSALRRSIERHRLAENRGYKVGQAATVIGVHRNTVRGWIQRGLLRAEMVGTGGRRDYLIPAAEVRRAAQAYRVSMDADPITDQQAEEYREALRSTKRTEPAAPARQSGRRRAES